MKIPAEFTLFAEKWTVVEDGLWLDRKQANGHCGYNTHKITLQPSDNADGLTRAGIEHTFCHELVHAIADSARVELDERDVDVMGGLLHQFMETQKGESK